MILPLHSFSKVWLKDDQSMEPQLTGKIGDFHINNK